MQLSPGEYFAIVRQLADPNDAGTYYVRAYVRNARTDVLLDTKDLTDRGGQRFSVEYQVPSVSSDAVYIAITTRVFTDSGYTTLSTDYTQEIQTYLVDIRSKHFGGGGGNGGVKVDYEKIKKMIDGAVGAIKFPAQQIPARPASVEEIVGAIRPVISSAVNAIPKGVSVSEISRAIGGDLARVTTTLKSVVEDGIRGIEFPEQKVLDLSPIMRKMHDGFEGMMNKSADELNEAIAKSVAAAVEKYAQDYKKLADKIRDTALDLIAQEMIVGTAAKKQKSEFEGKSIPELMKLAHGE